MSNSQKPSDNPYPQLNQIQFQVMKPLSLRSSLILFFLEVTLEGLINPMAYEIQRFNVEFTKAL
jgi:hypothetical protein